MRRLAPLPILLAATLLAACGGGDRDDSAAPSEAAPLRELRGAQEQAPAPTTAGALVQIADTTTTRGRIGYVNAGRLAELDGAAPARVIIRRVLEDGARRLDDASTATAVQVAGATVVSDDRGRRVIGADGALARTLATDRPQINAIQPLAQSAVQSCLGDTIAQTLVGPGTLGYDTALGAGLRSGADAPAGLKLVLCWSPHLVRDLHGAERRMTARFARTGAVIEEVEIGEREALSVVIPAAAIERDELVDLLGAGAFLRRLAAG